MLKAPLRRKRHQTALQHMETDPRRQMQPQTHQDRRVSVWLLPELHNAVDLFSVELCFIRQLRLVRALPFDQKIPFLASVLRVRRPRLFLDRLKHLDHRLFLALDL